MANMYDQYLYKPTNKEQLGLGIGSLISAALASTGGRNTGEALIRAAAGGLAGYGSGWKGMQDQYGDIFSRALADKRLQNQEQSMAIRNALGIENQGLRREKFGEEKRQYEEGKPERLAKTAWYTEKTKTVPKEKKPPKMPDVGNYGKLKAQLAGLRSPQNIDYMGMPAADRAKSIADIENAIRVMEQYQPDLIPPQQASAKTPQNAMTEEDIQFTAKKYGVSREEVLKRLGVQ